MMKCDTFSIQIYSGLRVRHSGETYELQDVYDILQEYVDDVGLCVSVTPTTYVYTESGFEHGVVIGLINYPRFPSTVSELRVKATQIAEMVMNKLRQDRVTICFPDYSITIGEE